MKVNSRGPKSAGQVTHRAHAIAERVIADLKNGPLAHLPSGQFWANSAWPVCAAIAFNLTRAAGTVASTFHARATTGTMRAQLREPRHAPSVAGSTLRKPRADRPRCDDRDRSARPVTLW